MIFPGPKQAVGGPGPSASGDARTAGTHWATTAGVSPGQDAALAVKEREVIKEVIKEELAKRCGEGVRYNARGAGNEPWGVEGERMRHYCSKWSKLMVVVEK